MTAESLRQMSRRDLEALARRKKLSGIRERNKEELVAVLVRQLRTEDRKQAASTSSSGPGRASRKKLAPAKEPAGATAQKRRAGSGRPAAVKRRERVKAPTNGSASAAKSTSGVFFWATPEGQDRLFSSPVDAHWFDIHWSLTASMLRRAEAFFGPDWRFIVPIIRVYDVTSEEGSVSARTLVRDEQIIPQATRWFVHVEQADRTWLFEIGLRGPSDRYFPLAHGEPVASAGPLSPSVRQFAFSNNGHAAPIGKNGHANGHILNGRSKKRGAGTNGAGERSAADGRFLLPAYNGHGLGGPTVTSLIPASVRAAHRDSLRRGGPDEKREEIDVVQLHAEVIVHGTTDPRSELRLMKDRIPLNSEGTFSLKIPLENGRIVIPIEHVSSDGSEQQTVILAVERSTRVLETQLLDETAE